MNWLPIMIVSLQVTLVAALGLIAGKLLRSAAHRHSALWAALLCILASPLFYAGVEWSGFVMKLPVLATTGGESAVVAPAPMDSTPAGKGEPLAALPEVPREFPESSLPSEPPASAEATPIAPATATQQQHGQANHFLWRADYLVVGLWLVGTLLTLVGVLRSQWKTHLILQSARPVGDSLDASVVAEAERRLGASGHLRVATTGKVAGPVVVGVFQPAILIPARYLETLSRDELLQVLIHEGAHALRRDPLVALLQRIGGAMFWWHPLVHLVNRELTRAREEVCDNFVLTHTEPETYGATLLRLATLSPAMARLPLAIGMFDGRGKLEERIRGLLDTRRQIMTRVRFVTAALVLSAFVLCSVVVAAARVGAQNPGDPSPPAVAANEEKAAPAEVLDAKDFRLILTYHGESDKPFYNLVLNVPPSGAQQANRSLTQQISEEQAGKLIKYLKESKFFEHAKVTTTQDDPTTGPQYLLRVRLSESHFEETLGWDVGTLLRLAGLRKSLDGDAAKLMDQLLARLEGQRKMWESGEVINDLQTTLSTEQETYSAGRAIPIKLELKNIGQQDREYGHHHFILSGSEIVVTDEHGRHVPYLGGGAGLTTRETAIMPGETKVIESCDLSDFYYLRRPGLYTVAFRQNPVFKSGVPSSNAVRFRVTADAGAAADGDPIGKFLRLSSQGGTLIGSPNAKAAVRPGRSRADTPGYQFVYVGQNGGLKGVKGIKETNFRVWLWLTAKAAEDAEPGDFTYLPDSEYLGKVARWHAYFYASPEALEAWPSVKHDVTEAIKSEEKPTDEKVGGADDDDYRLLHDRYRTLILAAAKAGKKEEIAKLSDKFNESIGSKLLYVQVVLRVGPIAEHATLVSKFFDPQRKIEIGKPHFAASAKPIVSQNHDGQGVVFIATNPLGDNKWPDDLQVTLVMDPVTKKDLARPPAKPNWGDTQNGLRTRVTAEKQSFSAGTPIPLRLEIENVGTSLWKYETPAVPHNNTLIVVDERGRPVPYVAGLLQVAVRLKELAPGAREEMKAFDLGESFYLRRPGRYSVRWPGGLALRGDADAPLERVKIPDTAPFEFDVTANPEAAADGDPIGRLLPLVKDKWWLTGTGKIGKVQPGGNREEVPGCFVFFHYNPTGYKADSGVVFLWLTEKAAAEQPEKAESATVSEYLGKVDRWHVYTHIDPNGGKAWPTAKEDIKSALAVAPAQHAAADKADLCVMLAVTGRAHSTTVPLHVVIENVGDKPQSHFEEWNSWGYGNVTVEWTDATGKTGTVAKVPGVFTRNFPSTVTLPPGEALVRKISFDPQVWQGWPEISKGTKLRLKVIYQTAPDPKVPSWTGKVSSPEQTVHFR